MIHMIVTKIIIFENFNENVRGKKPSPEQLTE